MGTKLFSDELPVHKGTVDTWIASLIQTKLGVSEWITPLGTDGKVPSQYISIPPLVWGNISGTLSDQTDLLTALGAKASTISPAFSGTPTSPTAQTGNNSLQIANTEFVNASIDAIPKSVQNETPLEVTASTTLIATNSRNIIVVSQSQVEITIFDTTGVEEGAEVLMISNLSGTDVIVKTADGSLLDTLQVFESVVYGITDNTKSNSVVPVKKQNRRPHQAYYLKPIDTFSYTGYISDTVVRISPTRWIFGRRVTVDTNVTSVRAVVVEYSNGVYTVGAEKAILGDNYYIQSFCALTDSKVVAGIANESYYNYALNLTINADLSITTGSMVAMDSTYEQYHTDRTYIRRVSDTQALGIYASATNVYYARLLTISGTTISAGVALNTGEYVRSAIPISSTLVACASSSEVFSLTISGTTLIKNTALARTNSIVPENNSPHLFHQLDTTNFLEVTSLGLSKYSITSSGATLLGTLARSNLIALVQKSSTRVLLIEWNEIMGYLHEVDTSGSVPSILTTRTLHNEYSDVLLLNSDLITGIDVSSNTRNITVEYLNETTFYVQKVTIVTNDIVT